MRPLQDLQEILLEAQSDLGQGFFVHEDGRLLYANGACSRITGYDREELMALPSVLDLVVPEERGMLLERMRQRLDGQDVAERYE
ncbi:MAG: PAS domain S-box protein, partial [Actinomycetota bacterium]|nr:PAS domain S-box protein [Actinomycetota bacterium]